MDLKIIISIIIFVLLFLFGMRIIRPTQRGLIERLGKYRKFARPGFHWIIPVIDQMYKINVTEIMIDAQPQEIITNDNLNASVDAQVYFKIKDDEENVKRSQYNVNNVQRQIVNLARTTLRNIIGTMTLKSANSERGKINSELHHVFVQETMNKIVKAENEKIAAIDYATAAETAADGEKRAAIKKAEGIKEKQILEATGEAEAIRLVNEAANMYFIGNAQLLKKLDTVVDSLKSNSKIVIPENTELVNVIGDLSGVLPLKRDKSQ
jgi:regulator of protease activity HflC (stomatin/prohibitin superfamily)